MSTYFKIGKLVATHGVKGEILLKHTLGKKTSLKGLQAIFIEENKNSFLPYFIESTQIRSDDELLLKLETVDSKESANRFTRKEIWLPEEQFKKYASKSAPVSLLGYQVLNNDEPLGEILEVIEQPHQILCRLEIATKEVLIPLNESTIQQINHRKKMVLVQLPEGLLEIYLG